MADLMWRTAKHEGVGNVVMEQVPIPEPGDNEVVARTQVSLISRGSEMGGRYLREGLVDPQRMGYSTTGVIHRVGAGVSEFAAGDRVVVTAPHAEYTHREGGLCRRLPGLSPASRPVVRARHLSSAGDEQRRVDARGRDRAGGSGGRAWGKGLSATW